MKREDSVAREAAPRPAGIFVELHRDLSLSDRVTQQLHDLILSGRLRPGDQLPAERDLAESFGVSRTVVREAVRSLAARGMVNVRAGHGSRVAAVNSSHVAKSMQLHLQGIGGIDYSTLHEVRTVLEQRIAHLAAQRARDEDVEMLRAVLERMRQALNNPEQAAVTDVAFHRTIAEMTGNPLFLVLLNSIGEVLMEIRRAILSEPGRVQEALDWHQRILDRIADGDPDGAERAMKEHLVDSLHLWGGSTKATKHRLRPPRAGDALRRDAVQQPTEPRDVLDAGGDATAASH